MSAASSGLARLLEVVRLGATPVLDHVTSQLRDVLQSNAGLAVSISPAQDGWSVDFGSYASTRDDDLLARFTDFVADHSSVWAYWNPARPEPAQRNVVRAVRWQALVDLPISRVVFKGTEAHGCDQLRVLVCEGASLLAWVGVLRSSPFLPEEERLLARLVKPLHKRLALERRLGSPHDTAALITCLQLLPGAAFVVSSGGHIRHANDAGRLLLDRAPRETVLGVRQALRGPSSTWRVVPVAATGWPEYSLVLEQQRDDLREKVEQASRKWAFTTRQREVLMRVARGDANKTIASDLDCSVRTVEVHLTSMFAKVGVDSRAALVSRVFRG